jgi:hypothetical protein
MFISSNIAIRRSEFQRGATVHVCTCHQLHFSYDNAAVQNFVSRHSSVGYVLYETGISTRFPVGTENILSTASRPPLVPTLPRTQWVLGVKQLERETDQSPLSRIEVKNSWRYTSTPPITVAAWSKTWTVFALSNAGIMGSNPTRGMDVCAFFFLCLCCSVFRLQPCDGLIPCPRCPTDYVKKITKLKKRPGPNERL